MVSSKDQAKKISQDFRQFSKKFFEDFYAKAEKRGCFPAPIEAMAALGRILKRATEGQWPPQPPGRPGVSAGGADIAFYVCDGLHGVGRPRTGGKARHWARQVQR